MSAAKVAGYAEVSWYITHKERTHEQAHFNK